MNYPDETVVKVGDLVWWDEGVCLGHIQTILENPSAYEDWSLNEPGVMIGNCHPFDPQVTGVFHPADTFEDEGVGMLSDSELEEFRAALGAAQERSRVGFKGHRYAVQTRAEDCELVEWIFRLFDSEKEIEQIVVPVKSRRS